MGIMSPHAPLPTGVATAVARGIKSGVVPEGRPKSVDEKTVMTAQAKAQAGRDAKKD